MQEGGLIEYVFLTIGELGNVLSVPRSSRIQQRIQCHKAQLSPESARRAQRNVEGTTLATHS